MAGLFQGTVSTLLLTCGLPCLLQFDQAYTSVLKRAINTLQVVLENSDQLWIPVEKTWRLNERHYGDLQVGQTPVAWLLAAVRQEASSASEGVWVQPSSKLSEWRPIPAQRASNAGVRQPENNAGMLAE